MQGDSTTVNSTTTHNGGQLDDITEMTTLEKSANLDNDGNVEDALVAPGGATTPIVVCKKTSDLSKSSGKSGCFVRLKFWILLLLLVLILCIIVGIVVFFVTRDNCECKREKFNSEESWQRCLKIADERRRCNKNKLCPLRNQTRLPPRPSVKDVRLPTAIMPEFYTLELQVYIHDREPEEFTFNGSTEILLNCFEDTDVIKIHSFSLNVNESLISLTNEKSGLPLRITNISHDFDRQWYVIQVAEQMRSGEKYRLLFAAFWAPLQSELKGWYYSTYKENGVKKYLATSQLQPTDARKVFPCFDEPGYKAKFQVTLVRRAEFHSLGNMPLERTENRADGWKADVFQPTLTMSTYLLAFVVSQFKSITGKDSKNRNFTVWSRPDVVHTANYSLHIGIKILEFFETYFQVDYPLNKTDMIAVPDFAAGAMENWGLMIYRELTMLWDPEIGSASSKQKVATVVSHEIAHQWFGNLVTLKWWDDLWLNEGFASFIEYVGVAHVHPSWLMDEQFALNDLQRVLVTDSSPTSHPVLMPVYNPDEINSIFDTISYNKGASVLRMMEAFLGHTTFRAGLRRYLSQHKYKNTVHNDLWHSLTVQAKADGRNINVKTVMDTWIKQMGYPVLTVIRKGPSEVELSQEHFLLNTSEAVLSHESPYNFTWEIPATYASKSKQNWNATNEVFWLNKKSSRMRLTKTRADDWVIFNLEQTGFYRVHYDTENWQRISQQLVEDHTIIPVKNRAQLLDDLFNLGKAGLVNYTLFMDLTLYLRSEMNYVPWEAAVRIFNYMDSMFAQDAYCGVFKQYIRSIINHFYRRVKWIETAEDSHIDNLIRPMAITMACQADLKDCIDEAKSQFREFLRNTTANKIPTSIRSIVYCIGIQYGSPEDWEMLYQEKLRTTHEDEITRMMRALGCSREIWILKKYLGMTLTSDSTKSEHLMDILIGISRNPAGKYLTWEFLRDNWNAVINELGYVFLNMPQTVDNLVSNEYHIKQLLMFNNFATQYNVGLSNERAYSQALIQAQTNLWWMQNYRETIGEWLFDQMGSLVKDI